MLEKLTAKSGLLIAAGILCLVLLFIGGPGPYSPRSYRYFWDFGHLFCFWLWTYGLLRWRPLPSFWRQLLLVLGLAFLVGGVTELLQALTGRSASWQDLGLDLLGSLLAVVFAAPSRSKLQAGARQLLQLVTLVLVAWSLLPLFRVVTDELIGEQQFPLLSGFETPLEVTRWGGSASRFLDQQVAYSGQASLRVELSTHRYSGIGLKHFPGDWSGYRWLQMQLFNPETEPLQLHFRIHDQQHRRSGNAHSDRYNTSISLPSGWSQLEVPLAQVATGPKGRPMDLSQVAGVILFVGKLERPRRFYIDQVQLLP